MVKLAYLGCLSLCQIRTLALCTLNYYVLRGLAKRLILTFVDSECRRKQTAREFEVA